MSPTLARLANKTLYLIGLAFLCLLLVGVVAAILEDPVVTAVPIAMLEGGARPEAEALRITDGLLYWNGATTYYREHLRTGKKEIDGYYVPVMSEALARRLESGESAIGFETVAVMAFITQETAERDFPFLSDNPFRTGNEAYPPASAHELLGKVSPGKSLPFAFKSEAETLLPGLDQDRLLVVAHDAPKETGAAIAGFVIILLAIVGVVGRRREQRSKRASAALFENQGAVQDVVFGDRVGHHTQPRGLASPW